MTIFVTWQLRVTLDSIRNSCDVWGSSPYYQSHKSTFWFWSRAQFYFFNHDNCKHCDVFLLVVTSCRFFFARVHQRLFCEVHILFLVTFGGTSTNCPQEHVPGRIAIDSLISSNIIISGYRRIVTFVRNRLCRPCFCGTLPSELLRHWGRDMLRSLGPEIGWRWKGVSQVGEGIMIRSICMLMSICNGGNVTPVHHCRLKMRICTKRHHDHIYHHAHVNCPWS